MARLEAHFSKRAHPGEPSDRWVRLQELALGTKAAPRADGLDLTTTNPEQLDLVWPPARDLVAEASRCSYAPEAAGPRATREVIARSYAERSRRYPISADDVLLTASTSESYSFLLHLLCDPDDAVLVPRPSYPLLPDLARLADVRLIPYDIRHAGHFQLDPASLPTPSEAAHQRIRAAIVVSPNNPTGHFTSQGELELLENVGIPLIVDEVFRSFVHRPSVAISEPLAAAGPVFVLDGLSKRAGLPGLKAGWIALSADAAFRKQAHDRLESVADTFLSVSATAQNSLIPLLARERDLGSSIRRRVGENLELLRTQLTGTALTLLGSDAGWSAIVRLPAVRSEERYFEELAALGVWVHPGALYELSVGPCFVLSLLGPPAELQAGVGRLLQLVASV